MNTIYILHYNVYTEMKIWIGDVLKFNISVLVYFCYYVIILLKMIALTYFSENRSKQ